MQYTLQKVDESIEIDDTTYTPVFTFADDKGRRIQVIHYGTYYRIAGQDRAHGPYRFIDEINSRVLQVLQGLPDPMDALDVPEWSLRTRTNLVRFTRPNNGVRPIFACYCTVLHHLSSMVGENHESKVLRQILDLIWPCLDEIERAQTTNLSSVLWSIPTKQA